MCRSGVCKHVHRHRRQIVFDGKLIQYSRQAATHLGRGKWNSFFWGVGDSNCFRVNFSLEGGGNSSVKIIINLPSYFVKENHIGSVVSEILQYRQTDTHKQISCYFIIRINSISISNIFPHDL